jgi:hypothetical protein
MLIGSKKVDAAEVARAASQMRTVVYRLGLPLGVCQLRIKVDSEVSALVQHTKLQERISNVTG